MGVAGDLLLVLAGAAVVVAAPLTWAFATLVIFWLLVPGSLIVPYAPHLLLVNSVVLYAFALRLLARRGPHEPPPGSFRPTPVHAALGVLLLVGFADGVILAPASLSLASDLDSWLRMVDLAVLFVVVLAVVRKISPRRAAGVIVAVATVVVVVGIGERLLHHGWSHFFFEGLPASYLATGASTLATRGGHIRSQGAAQFALEYGWVMAMLLPMAIFTSMRWSASGRRWARLALLIPLFTMLAVVLSISRSAEVVGAAAAVALVLAAANEWKLASWGIGAVAIGAVVAIVDSSLITNAFAAGTSDPASIRLDRLPPLFSLVVHRPFTGLGFSGISAYFGGLDDAYAMVYATLGVVGILAWLTLGATAFASLSKAFRAPRGSEVRTLGAACLVGIVTFAFAGAAYDTVNTAQSLWTLVFLVAVGVGVSESIPAPAPARRRWLGRLLLPVGGAGVGLAVFSLAPVSVSESFSLVTVAPWVLQTEGVVSNSGMALVNTLCPSLTNPDTTSGGASVQCLDASTIFPNDFPGTALVTVRAPTVAALHDQVVRSFAPLRFDQRLEGGPVGGVESGSPAWTTTAPLTGAVAGLVTMLLLPPSRRRRRGLRASERTAGDGPREASVHCGLEAPQEALEPLN